MVKLGEQIAFGRTSEVFAAGNDSVVKVLRDDVPPEWAELEGLIAGTVGELDLPVPEYRGLMEVGGRPGIVFERVHGESMWQRVLDDPNYVDEAVRSLAAVQRSIHQANMPSDVPGLVQRLRRKINAAHPLTPSERDEGCGIVDTLPRGAALLHGDLHPGNVLLIGDSPVVIDWFDAAIGHPVADMVRSSILMRPGVTETNAPHLPNATPALLARLHDAYALEFETELQAAADARRSWEAVIAAGRMSEQAQRDESALLAIWSDRQQSA